jgi:hypothetical protein
MRAEGGQRSDPGSRRASRRLPREVPDSFGPAGLSVRDDGWGIRLVGMTAPNVAQNDVTMYFFTSTFSGTTPTSVPKSAKVCRYSICLGEKSLTMR